MIPTEDAYCHALQTYREKWPHDGYFLHRQRFIETDRFLCKFYTNGPIVDVGGWPGDFSCTLASLGLSVFLLDKDLTRLTSKVFDPQSGKWVLGTSGTLQDKCHAYGVEMIECDIEREKIPTPNEAFDFIVFTEVIEHLRIGVLAALRELRRILKPNGCLLITTPNLLSLQNRLSFVTGRACYDTLEMPYDALEAEERIGHAGHFRVFSMPEVLDLLQRTGFHVRYAGYHQLVEPDEAPQQVSLYALRMQFYHQLARWIPSLGNQLYLLATRT
jgi:2-polyprenyl-3-methyl-5-hydroxy-6-metoxy-1,4-benzoquinol methylase